MATTPRRLSELRILLVEEMVDKTVEVELEEQAEWAVLLKLAG